MFSVVHLGNANNAHCLCTKKVFLEYDDVDGSSNARAGMHGRKFSGNQVVAGFYPENKFAQGDYDG